MTAATDAQTHVFTLPDLGEGLTEAEILNWRVAVGDQVGVDDIVVEVETAKAAVDVPCPFAGTVTELHGSVGDVVEVGKPLVSIAPQDAAPATGASGSTDNIGGSAAHDAHRTEERAGSGAVLVGYGTSEGARRRRRRARRSASTPAGEAPSRASASGGNGNVAAVAPRVISPVVRRIAREQGIDLSTLSGSGPAGVILRRDIEAALSGSAEPEQRIAAEPAMPARGAALEDKRIPLRGVRRTVADKLSRSRTEIPDATTWVDVDATGLAEAREALRSSHPGVGLMALLARFVVAGLVKFPELNSSVEGDEIVQHGRINLGFAAQTDRGLVVPVVRNAEQLSTVQLGHEIARLTGAARDGNLDPADLTGGTITLNNYGVFGVDGSTPIINHPEAALLGVGRIVDKPWVVDGALAVRKVTQLSLTFDHRVCDGATAGGFLRYVADCVERPLALLADL